MGNLNALLEKAGQIGERITRFAKQNRNIIIVSHLDADGLATASILGKAIHRKKGRFLLRVVGDLHTELVTTLKSGEYDLHIFCDLGGGAATELSAALGDKWVVVDHHQIPEPELTHGQIVNAWQYGFDGGLEVSGAGIAYFVAKQMDEANLDLAWIPVIGAIGDRQDQGERRSLFGLNRLILEDAMGVDRIAVATDLMLYGRETKPIHEAIAATTTPFIPGLSGNKDTCLAALTSARLKLQENGRWRTVAELSEEEKQRLVEAIIPHLTQTGKAGEGVEELIGEVYTLRKEEEYSPLRDAREFATLLNACGRMKQAGIGVAICMGDRTQALQEAEKVLAEYRQALNRCIQAVLGDSDRLVEKPKLVTVNGDGLVEENMLGAISSILSGMGRFHEKIVMVRTATASGEVKFSARRSPGADPSLNLGLIMNEAAGAWGGKGGGHDAAAGARIPLSALQNFTELITERIHQKK